jgi:hypothetical protein
MLPTPAELRALADDFRQAVSESSRSPRSCEPPTSSATSACSPRRWTRGRGPPSTRSWARKTTPSASIDARSGRGGCGPRKYARPPTTSESPRCKRRSARPPTITIGWRITPRRCSRGARHPQSTKPGNTRSQIKTVLAIVGCAAARRWRRRGGRGGYDRGGMALTGRVHRPWCASGILFESMVQPERAGCLWPGHSVRI